MEVKGTELQVGTRYFLDELKDVHAEFKGYDEDGDPEFDDQQPMERYGKSENGLVGFADNSTGYIGIYYTKD